MYERQARRALRLRAPKAPRNHDLIQRKSPAAANQRAFNLHSGTEMNSTHIQIRAFIPYVVLGAGLIIVVSFLAPPSATQHSLERVISIANERSQNAQPAAGATVLRSFAPQGPLLDAAPTVAKKALDGGQETPSVMWQTAIASEGDAATRLSPAEQPNLACTAWLEGWADPAKHEGQLEWILGFVTGSNYRSEGQGRPENADEVEIFIEHYCRNYPEHQLFMAAAALVQESGGPAALHEQRRPASPAQMGTRSRLWRATCRGHPPLARATSRMSV